jgi:hypothetical protein
MDTAAVIEQISAAFGATSLPAAALLVKDHCDECIDTYRLFWDVPHSFMTWQSAAARKGACMEAALLTPDAWRYYLPAMMIWCVRDTDNVDALVNNLVYQMTPRASRGREFFEERAPGFSVEQRRAIITFLEWYQQKEEAEWASIERDPSRAVSAAIEHWRARQG